MVRPQFDLNLTSKILNLSLLRFNECSEFENLASKLQSLSFNPSSSNKKVHCHHLKKKKKWIHSITVLHTIWTHLNLQIYKHVSDFKPKLRIDMGELDFDVVHAKQRSWVSSILKELWKQTIKKIGTVHGVFNDKICCTSFGLKSKMY